jgi:nucleoside-diphosphate kinase|tara:strand:- start:239 stop:640 length:402 start_codon:yes stop_codon:yes gene_type:complete
MKNTLAIIKPDAMKKGHLEDIRKDILDAGFDIVEEKTLNLSNEQACGFYDIHKDKPFFGELVEFMTSHECHVMKLEKENAVVEWRNLMGATDSLKAEPGTIRNKYGTDISMNATHGSDSNENANKEIEFFFND